MIADMRFRLRVCGREARETRSSSEYHSAPGHRFCLRSGDHFGRRQALCRLRTHLKPLILMLLGMQSQDKQDVRTAFILNRSPTSRSSEMPHIPGFLTKAMRSQAVGNKHNEVHRPGDAP